MMSTIFGYKHGRLDLACGDQSISANERLQLLATPALFIISFLQPPSPPFYLYTPDLIHARHLGRLSLSLSVF